MPPSVIKDFKRSVIVGKSRKITNTAITNINIILNNKEYKQALEKLSEYEKNREFCNHLKTTSCSSCIEKRENVIFLYF